MRILFLGYTSKNYNAHNIKIDRSDLTRKMSCMETWVQRIINKGHDVIFFDGGNESQSFDEKNKILHLISDESYDYPHFKTDGIPSKMFERLKEGISWALDNKEFDYLFRTDDSSYLNAFVLDEMIEELKNYDVMRGVSGGGGAFMSRNVCEDLIKHTNEKKFPVEDLVLWNFFNEKKYKTKNTNKLCYQYILNENYFSIHYTNGKRQYYVDDVISFYHDNKPIKRKVILNYELDVTKTLNSNTWDSNFEKTPIYYSMDKDLYNWEYYGPVSRNYFPVEVYCPFSKNSIQELFFYNTKFIDDIDNTLNDYINCLMDDGVIYFFYKNKEDLEIKILEKLNLKEESNYINIKTEFIKKENGYFIKLEKRK